MLKFDVDKDIYFILHENGDKWFYKNNEFFKKEMFDGEISYWKNNNLHREDGPAGECANGMEISFGL